MRVEAGVTRICFFDLHVSAAALRAPALLHPSVAFLADPAEYEKRQDQSWTVDTAHFRFRPIGVRFAWNSFWNGFRTLCKVEGAKEKFARFHLPLDCRPKDCVLTATLPAPFGRVPVHIKLFVWPYGWSTHLEISIASPASLPSLVDASAALRRAPMFDARTGAGASILSGVALSGVFRQASTWFHEDVFTSAVPDQRVVARHAVISLSGFVSPADPFTYSTDIDPEHPQLPTADRARLHAIVLGRPMTLPELVERELERRHLVTPLATGFALTHFDHGSLLVLLKATPRSGKPAAAARCLWRNTASMLTTTSALRAADRGLRTKPPDLVDARADWAVRVLERVPSYYSSLLCQRIFKAHAGLLGKQPGSDDAE